MNRRTNLKKVDKRMAKVIDDFKRSHLVMKKVKSAMGKMRSAGRYIAPLGPEQWLTSFCIFVINALPSSGGGKIKKALLKLLKEHYSPEEWANMEPLYETMIDDAQSQMLVEGYESPIDEESYEELMSAVEQLDEEVASSGKLTVKKLNNEVRKVQRKKLTVKEQMRLRFHQFLKAFEEKLKSMGYEGDENLSKFLGKLINVVHRVNIGKGKEAPKTVPSKAVVGG